MKSTLTILACLLLAPMAAAGCSSAPSAPDGAPTASTTEIDANGEADHDGFDGHQRLPQTASPTRYDLELTIDPATDRFSGVATIDVDLHEATDVLYLHGEELTIDEATVTVGEATEQVEAVRGDNGGLAVHLPEALAAGTSATLTVRYDAALDEIPTGLYRVEDGGRWYAFTQFEPLEARTAFPSFDEPRFKTPFAVTIRVPRGLKAFANAPLAEASDAGQWTVHRFEPTAPLPTYLVALAVGDLEVVEADEPLRGDVPLRIITTKGKSDLAAYALERTPPIAAFLSDYFGRPIPYAKLDMVAVPNFRAGAMENVGLVTYRESLLLLDADEASADDRYAMQSVIAHELAHMWFGNFVTPTWWDDLWLNEAFATWMATKTMAAVDPALESKVDAVRGTLRVMGSDALESARAIRQPITGGGDVYNAFDGITYTKGRAILSMFERWLGEEAFRTGVVSYLEAHGHQNATTGDLLTALASASGKPVEQTIEAFLDQPGTPLLDITYRCEAGQAGLDVHQSRYLPAGSSADQGEPWQVPMCVRYGFADGDQEARTTCALIDAKTASVDLEGPGCPTWLHPNADEAGYYHWKLPTDLMVGLAGEHRDQLTLPEKVALLSHVVALVEAQTISYDVYLTIVDRMAAEDHRIIVDKITGALGTLEKRVVDETTRPAFVAWTKKLIGRHADRLGFHEKDGEPVADRLVRPDVVRAMVDYAGDTALRAEAKKTAAAYLAEPGSVAPADAELALRIAAWDGDDALWQSMHDAIAAAPTPGLRVATIRALGNFRDPELQKRSLDLFLTDTLRAQDFWTVAGPSLSQPENFEITWQWLQDNIDAVVAKLGKRSSASLPWVGAGFCSTDGRAEVTGFFEGRDYPGIERNLNKALESMERCARYKDYIVEDGRRFLKVKGKR